MRPEEITGESDARLVERSRGGDRHAFEILVRRYLRASYVLALSELADAGDAEDAVQDAFVIALERLDECRDPAAFGGWLKRIVRNRARSVGRRERVRAVAGLESVSSGASTSDPERDLDRTELRRRLEEALSELTEVQRRVVLMHDLEGYRHREIARELRLPEGTVRSHLFFARRALRRRLGSAYEPERTDG